jgi:hypothetical protein
MLGDEDFAPIIFMYLHQFKLAEVHLEFLAKRRRKDMDWILFKKYLRIRAASREAAHSSSAALFGARATNLRT